jgi:hypothetical protein
LVIVHLKFLSGKKAGAVWSARRFPVRIGRAANADLRLEDAGIWDYHLSLDFQPSKGFFLEVQPNALARLNDQPVQRAPLRNGDLITLGPLQLQFWLGETRQAGLRFREGLTWAGIAAVSLAQIALIYWLILES